MKKVLDHINAVLNPYNNKANQPLLGASELTMAAINIHHKIAHHPHREAVVQEFIAAINAQELLNNTEIWCNLLSKGRLHKKVIDLCQDLLQDNIKAGLICTKWLASNIDNLVKIIRDVSDVSDDTDANSLIKFKLNCLIAIAPNDININALDELIRKAIGLYTDKEGESIVITYGNNKGFNSVKDACSILRADVLSLKFRATGYSQNMLKIRLLLSILADLLKGDNK